MGTTNTNTNTNTNDNTDTNTNANNNANYKRYKTHHDLIVLDSKKNARKAAVDKEANEDNKLFVELLVKYWEENIYKVFSKISQKQP